MPGVIFSEEAADRIARAVRFVETHGNLTTPVRRRAHVSTAHGFTARVTGTVDGNGNYPAVITQYDPDTGTWVDYATVKLRPANGETLTNGTRYDCRPSGLSGSEDLFVVTGALSTSAGIAGISVSNYFVDGYETMVDDSTPGIRLAYPLEGVANAGGRVDIFVRPASLTYDGIVTTGTQHIGGQKFFQGVLQCETLTYSEGLFSGVAWFTVNPSFPGTPAWQPTTNWATLPYYQGGGIWTDRSFNITTLAASHSKSYAVLQLQPNANTALFTMKSRAISESNPSGPTPTFYVQVLPGDNAEDADGGYGFTGTDVLGVKYILGWRVGNNPGTIPSLPPGSGFSGTIGG